MTHPPLTLLHGDSLALLRDLPDVSVDAVVTDPPAGISFMGRDWDSDRGGRRQWVDWMASVMREVLRVLKPGAHAFVWALPKTAHWTAWALENAGFEIRDVVVHLFGTGFPKNKALLKPGAEHWVLCRKPLSEKNIAANVERWGVGLLNIDACRIDLAGKEPHATAGPHQSSGAGLNPYFSRVNQQERAERGENPRYDPAGRWPANVILSPDAAEEVDRQSGPSKSVGGPSYHAARPRTVAKGAETSKITFGHSDSGGASRFFYVAKPSAKEKHAGCEDRNKHPTVKPLALMSHLVHLVTPPGGMVLDPFLGSGTTGKAAVEGGFGFIGMEQDAGYFEIAQARLAACK